MYVSPLPLRVPHTNRGIGSDNLRGNDLPCGEIKERNAQRGSRDVDVRVGVSVSVGPFPLGDQHTLENERR